MWKDCRLAGSLLDLYAENTHIATLFGLVSFTPFGGSGRDALGVVRLASPNLNRTSTTTAEARPAMLDLTIVLYQR